MIVLDDDNFDEVVSSFPLLLVEFYAPWCGHCKKLEPEYATAASELKALDEPIRIAKLDATAARTAADKYGIKGFPTLKLFRGLDSVSEYDGGRTSSDIVKFMKKKSGPAFASVEDKAAVDAIVEKNDLVVLGVFDDADSGVAQAFKSYALKNDDVAFALGTSAALKKEFGTKIVLFKNFDEGRNDLDYTDKTEEGDIKQFVAGNSLPLVIEFSQENAPKIFGGDINVHVLTFVNKEADYADATLDALQPLGTEFKGRALQVVIPSSEERIVEYFGITEDQMPATVVAKMGDSGIKKYAFEGEWTGDAVKAHVTDFFAGKLKPSLKSEEPAASDREGPVTVLRGKSFQEIVLDGEEDVLVEFYAPWCGHCKSLDPKYTELGEKFSGVDSVIIAKMDATANEIDVDGVDVKGFPTLIFFPGNKKDKPMPYDGAREVDGFVSFLQKNAATSFSLEGLDKDEL